MARVGRNDPCPCGTKAKYKNCCSRLDEGRAERDKSARSAKNLREKNITLLNGATDIFGLNRPWEKVKASLSDARIREFYTFVARLWPTASDVSGLLPEPDSNLRALYLGEYEPELMVENVFRFCLYADQILLTNPFPNPNIIAEKFNPMVHPDEWRVQTQRLIYHLKILAPWIDDGLVVLIPEPSQFDHELRRKSWDLAGERLKGWEPSEADMDQSMMSKRLMEDALLWPREFWERKLREQEPTMSDAEVSSYLDYIERERKKHPLLPNETLDRMSGQMLVTHTGANLEMAMYICQATGAFPYTNIKFRWKEILRAGHGLDSTAKVWSPLTNAFQKLQFKFLNNVDPDFACSIRHDGRLEGFRSYLRKVWTTVGGTPDLAKSDSLARDFRDELTQAFNEAQADWSAIDRDLLNWGIPRMGKWAAGGVATAVATGRMSLELPAAGFVIGGVTELIKAAMSRRAFKKKVPMSIFIDLDKR